MITEQTMVRQIEENEYKLLGQVEISDEDYDVLLNHTKNRAKYAFVQTIIKPDLLLGVQLAVGGNRSAPKGEKTGGCFTHQGSTD